MSLEEIGQRLKSARANAGLSLSQINERTKIPFNHLEAIEQGNFDDLPEPVYVANFIKRYSDCVGLDGQQTADDYRQELDNLSAKPEKSGFLFKSHKSQKNHNNAPPAAYYNRKSFEQAAPNLMKMIPFYALWVVVILALIIYLFNRQESIDLAQQDPSILALKQSTAKLNTIGQNDSITKAKTADASTIVPGPDKSIVSADASQDSSANSTPSNEITVQAKKHVWVEVKAISSGEALFTGFMEGGTTKNFTDAEGLRIRAGNGGNVSITAAGKTEDLGVVGKITERAFAISGKPLEHNTDSTVSLTHNDTQTTATPKKAAEKQSSVKKPLVATTTHKPGSSSSASQGTVAHKSAPSEGISGDNKGIDVPYRY